jgi:hypothetical protein
MANTISFKQGTEANRVGITPTEGEFVYTTDDKKLYIGDGATAGGNVVSGAGGSIEAVATGALSNGSTVILNSDGTVSIVAETGSPLSIPAGAEYVFNSGGYTQSISCSFDPNTAGKFVVAYQDHGNSLYGTAVVGTVSGTTISFGSEYVFNSGDSQWVSVSFDPNTAGKFVVAYTDAGNSYYGTAVVGTVSGTAITFGAEYVFNSAGTSYNSISFDPNTAGKFVVAYRDGGSINRGTAVVGTVSGTTLSFGAEYVFNPVITDHISVSFDPNTAGKFVVAYNDAGNADKGTAVVGTVSGTAISYSAEYLFNSVGDTAFCSLSFDPNTANKFVVAYRDGGNSYYGTAIVGTVSGTTLSFGAEYVFNSGTASYISCSFDPSTSGKFVVAYQDSGNAGYGTAVVGTVSGTAISYSAEYVFNSGSTTYNSCSFDPNTAGKFVVAYTDDGNFLYGTAIVGQISTIATNLTTTNFIGISDGAYLDTATATIQTIGAVNVAQSGLTPALKYYVQGDGTIATTPDTPDVYAGLATTSTNLLIEG